MRIIPFTVALFVTAFPLAVQATDATPDADEQVLIKQVQADKRAVFAQNLGLTDAESTKFWPIYDEYEGKRQTLDERYITMINDYAAKYDTLTDDQAAKILDERMTIEKKQLELRDEYTGKIAKVLPGKKALRYAQLESRIQNIQRRNLYSIIPLAR